MEIKPLIANKEELLSTLNAEDINKITTLLANFDKEVLNKTGAIDILIALESSFNKELV